MGGKEEEGWWSKPHPTIGQKFQPTQPHLMTDRRIVSPDRADRVDQAGDWSIRETWSRGFDGRSDLVGFGISLPPQWKWW